jgi:hypothetical protein
LQELDENSLLEPGDESDCLSEMEQQTEEHGIRGRPVYRDASVRFQRFGKYSAHP